MSTDVADIFLARENPTDVERWSRTRQLVVFILVGVGSALCAMPWLMALRDPHVLPVAVLVPTMLPVWIAILMTAPRYWHISIIADFLVRVALLSSGSLPLFSALWCLGSTIEIVVIATVLRALGVRLQDLPTLKDAALYLAIFTAVVLIGSAVLALLVPDPAWRLIRTRVAIQVFGAVTVLPAALSMVAFITRHTAIVWTRLLELLLIVAGSFAVEFLVPGLSGGDAMSLLVLAPVPLLLWAALRVGPAMVGLVMFSIAASYVFNIDFSLEESRLDVTTRVATVLLYVSVIALPLILLSVVLKERRNMEAALRASHDRYELATSAAAVYVWEWNLVTDEVRVDPAFTRRLGFRSGEIGNSFASWSALCIGNDACTIARQLDTFLMEGNTPFEATYRMRDRDGNTHWFNSRGRAVDWENGRPVRLVGSVIDITDQRRIQDTLRATRRTLENFRRVSELSEVAAGIAHEVSQPLCAMMTNAAACQRWLAAGHTQDAPFMQEALTNILSNGNRAADIIARTRDMFRSRGAGHHVQSLNDIVKDTLRVAGPRIADARVLVETRFDVPNPQVRGDCVQLQQVFHNFILNALEAMGTEERSERRLRIWSYSESAGEICIAFHDTGTGLESTDIEQLCRPFYTTKATGTGMGLAIVRKIIKSHGGRLRARSNDANGATFEVVLPTV